MASSTSTATPSKLGFEERVMTAKTIKNDINALILDYLTMEGFPQAAANFSKEANLKPQQDNSFISTRQKIKSAIHRGDIEEAITSLNHFNPEILDQDPELFFALLRLQLVELIRTAGRNGTDFKTVIKFAQEQLAPRALREEFLAQLEETMVMLFFVPEKMPPVQQRLLSSDLRREVADQVNKAILYHHSRRREAAIRRLVKMRAWAESTARENPKAGLPATISIGLHFPGQKTKDHEHDAMVTN